MALPNNNRELPASSPAYKLLSAFAPCYVSAPGSKRIKDVPQMIKLLLVLGLLVLVPNLAFAQATGTYYADYFANNSGPLVGSADQIIRIINLGTLGTPLTSPVGDICVNIYVFDANQELIACCAERLTPNELDSAYVGRQLTNNPVTSVIPRTGVIKIVLAPPPPGGCDPTVSLTAPDASLGAVITTHLQKQPPDDSAAALYVTETEKPARLLTAAEEEFLQTACAFALFVGSGKGICTSTISDGQY
jgi:hypothetical protein